MRVQPYLFLVLSLLTLLILLRTQHAQARDIVFGKAKETLAVSFGVDTLFRFPMEVKTITEAQRFEIRVANTEEPDYSVLRVKPRFSEGVSDVTFVLSDGSVIRTQLVISNKSNLKKDSIYDFKPKDELLGTNPNLLDNRAPLSISELDLLRSMIAGDRISGFEVRKMNQVIPLADAKLEAAAIPKVTLVKSYTGSQINGFVYRIECAEKEQSLSLHIENLSIGQPNLALLSQSNKDFLECDSAENRETFIRVVTKPGASFRKFILPTAIEGEKRHE